MEDFLTLTEAATYLGVSRQTLWRRIRDGALPVHVSDVNRRTRFVKRADLDRRFRLAGLDLGDEARRDTQSPGKLPEPDVLLLPRGPEAMAKVVAEALPVEPGALRSGHALTTTLFTRRPRAFDTHVFVQPGQTLQTSC